MKRWTAAVAIFATVILGTHSEAKVLLPLEHGVYVDAEIPCASAPTGGVVTYFEVFGWFKPSVCNLRKLSFNRWKTSCYYLEDVNGNIPAPVFKGTLTIMDLEHIRIDGRGKRWCAATIEDFLKDEN
jgi:hypothetical protein